MQVTFNLLMTSEEEKRGSPSSSLRTHSNTAIYTSFSIPTFPTEHKQVKFAKDLCKDVLGDLLLVKRLPKGSQRWRKEWKRWQEDGVPQGRTRGCGEGT